MNLSWWPHTQLGAMETNHCLRQPGYSRWSWCDQAFNGTDRNKALGPGINMVRLIDQLDD